VKPVRHSLFTQWEVITPRRLTKQAAQISARTKHTVGIEANDQKLPLGCQYPLDLPQGLMWIRRKFKTMVGDHHIDAITIEGQFICPRDKTGVLSSPRGAYQPMIYWAYIA
jgi:hypothetical protein